jgi:hypothetical protein
LPTSEQMKQVLTKEFYAGFRCGLAQGFIKRCEGQAFPQGKVEVSGVVRGKLETSGGVQRLSNVKSGRFCVDRRSDHIRAESTPRTCF